MKTLAVLAMALVLVFSMAAVVMAEGNFYFDLGISGSSTNTMKLPNLDLGAIGTNPALLGATDSKMSYDGTSGYLIGGEYNFGRYKVVAEYTGNTFKNTGVTGTKQPAAGGGSINLPGNSDLNFTANVTLIKGGYRFLDNDRFKLDAVIGYLGLNVTGMSGNYTDANFSNGGPVVGLDGSYDVSEKFSISASYGATIGASSSMKAMDKMSPTSSESSLTAWRIKGLYMVNEKWGAYLSYSNLNSYLKYKFAIGEVTVDSVWSGWALGANYKF